MMEYMWNNENLLKNYLLSKGMFLSGSETLSDLQNIAETRYSITLKRGTPNMITEIQRMVNDQGSSSSTNIDYKGAGQCGWVCGRSSPCYRISSIAVNLCYLNVREILVFNLKNNSNLYTNNDVENIIQNKFKSKGIRSLYNFIPIEFTYLTHNGNYVTINGNYIVLGNIPSVNSNSTGKTFLTSAGKTFLTSDGRTFQVKS